MSEKSEHEHEDIQNQDGELLPDREMMSVARIPEESLLFPDERTYEVSPEDPPAT